MADTVEFKPETLTAEAPASGIKDQYKQGPQEQPVPRQPTMEEILKYREQEMIRMEAELPYMRMKEEYNRLELALYEQGVILGAIPLTNQEGKLIIPGLLGMELYLRQEELVQQFSAYRTKLMDIANKMERDQAEKSQAADNLAD